MIGLEQDLSLCRSAVSENLVAHLAKAFMKKKSKRAPRFVVHFHASIDDFNAAFGNENVIDAITEDISYSGIRLTTNEQLRVNQKLYIHIKDNKDQSYVFRGRVARVTDKEIKGLGTLYELGIQFNALTARHYRGLTSMMINR